MTVEERCRKYSEDPAESWARLMREYRAEGEDAFALFSHASYLFRSHGVRFGVDACLPGGVLPEEIAVRAAEDLSSLSFLLVTHFHGDHFSPAFCEALGGNETLWVVPDFAPEKSRMLIEKNHRNVRFVCAGDVVDIDGHRIIVLPGHHYDDGGSYGVDSYGYAVETPERSLYFPGDVRDFKNCRVIDYPNADVLFAHVWLGRNDALLPYSETLFEDYCAFLIRAHAKKIYFTHLYDFTRKATQLWTERHAAALAKKVKEAYRVMTEIPCFGTLYPLP